ncbi:MAG: hypothetical protein HYT70_00460 [Candidatus Aenigmarchaeota archaeon]|nr:hypothetical protein [Candidatus Aenigmarchaeota archaeon]
MRKGQAALIILVAIAAAIVLFLLISPNFKNTSKGPLKYKNEVVTIEKIFVSAKAPYTSTDSDPVKTTIQFEVHNNGDQDIPYLEIDFFDLSGFSIDAEGSRLKLNCGLGEQAGARCIYSGSNSLTSLDSREVSITLVAPKDIKSPTPYTISYGVKYLYFGTRDFNIPVIDGTTKKQPSSQLRQSTPSIGPVAVEIEPAIERTLTVGDETIKQYWGISGDNAFPFITKFKFNQVGAVQGKLKDINLTDGNVTVKLTGLDTSGLCDFGKTAASSFSLTLPGGSKYEVPNTQGYNLVSKKPVVIPFNSLLCTFTPNQKLPEYTATISAAFAYQYEYIMTQEFVVQPSPK